MASQLLPTARTVRVKLSPTPGYCVKTTSLQQAVCSVTSESSNTTTASSLIDGIPGTLVIPKGIKIFVNIAWDANVPPPPEGSEDMIQKAMRGEDDMDDENFLESGGWFVPVIISEPRQDLDKAGKPSIIFDCVYQSSLKSRALRDPAFKTFLTELAFQRIEIQHQGVVLARQIGTPNISAKGKLLPRTVLIPVQLFPDDHPMRRDAEKAAKEKQLIEEVGGEVVIVDDGTKGDGDRLSEKSVRPQQAQGVKSGPPKGILKNQINDTKKNATVEKTSSNLQSKINTAETIPAGVDNTPVTTPVPKFDWSKDGDRLRIVVKVPKVTHALILQSTLDIETRRIILTIPSLFHLDLNLDLSDAEIQSLYTNSNNVDGALMLKRQRDLDVDGATAQWRVGEDVLVITA